MHAHQHDDCAAQGRPQPAAVQPELALSLATAMLITVQSEVAALLHHLPPRSEALFSNRLTAFPTPCLDLDDQCRIEVLRDGRGYRFSRSCGSIHAGVAHVAGRGVLMTKITDHVIARVIAAERSGIARADDHPVEAV